VQHWWFIAVTFVYLCFDELFRCGAVEAGAYYGERCVFVAVEGITRLLVHDGILTVHISRPTAAGEKVAFSHLVSYCNEWRCACQLTGKRATWLCCDRLCDRLGEHRGVLWQLICQLHTVQCCQCRLWIVTRFVHLIVTLQPTARRRFIQSNIAVFTLW